MGNSEIHKKTHPAFHDFFSSLKDPRRTAKGNHLYPLNEILFLCISAVLSGADSWAAISSFGKAKTDWLRKYCPYEKGTPSHDILGELFARIDRHQFSTCFTDWIASISSLTNGEVVAIDGKTICHSDNKASGKTAIHVVSAYASANRLCLGQQVAEGKGNEITAIPELLKLLEVKGCIITIDAMGCQKRTAREIIEQGADYVLMVKDNQGQLREQVEKMFKIGRLAGTDTQIDAGHGRVETRKCDVIGELTFMDDKEDWVGLNRMVRIQSERFGKQTAKTTKMTRYYIGSGTYSAKQFNQNVRQHWSVENNLHWSLDVVFKEDGSLKKKGNSAENYNIIAKMALSMIDKEKSTKASKPAKRLTAAWNDDYRSKLLNC